MSSASHLTVAADAFVGVVRRPSADSDLWAGFASVIISSYCSIQIVAACIRAIRRFHCQIKDDWIVSGILTAVVKVVVVGLVTATAIVHYQTTIEN